MKERRRVSLINDRGGKGGGVRPNLDSGIE